MYKQNQSRHSHFKLHPICLAIALAFVGFAAIAENSLPSATNNTGASDTPSANAKAPLNGYADTLKPKVKRPAAFQNQPYQPIKKQDDQAQIPEIEMFVGESRVFPAPGVARIAVGNGQILTAAALDNKEVLLFANAVGTSSLFVWNEDGRYQRVKINIVPGDTSRFAREIAAFLSTIPNAKASIIGDKVVVEGDKLSDMDLAKIDELSKRYPQIVNFTDRLGWEQMVMMDVKVVEFPVDELRELGMKWNATGGAAIGGIWAPVRYGDQTGLQIEIKTGSNNSIPITNANSSSTGIPLPSSPNILSAINLGLNAQLNLLAQNGKATILAEPQLAARSGSKASFLAGGEFPYSIATLTGVSVYFKPYGIKLDIHPKVDRNGLIRATIESEVSKIDSSVASTGGPALLTRKTNTEFNVRSGETMVLSGLIQVDNSTNIDKVPLLGDIPVLGALFRSKRFQNRETELVVFVTPTVVDSRTPALVDRVERTTERLQQNLGRPEPYLIDPLQPSLDPGTPNQFVPRSEAKLAADPPIATIQPAPIMPTGNVKLVSASEHPLQTVSAALQTVQARPLGGSMLQVAVEGLVVRAEPSTQSAALMQLGRGAVVQMTAREPQRIGAGAWRHIVVGEIQGWVRDGVEPAKLQPNLLGDASSPSARVDQQGPSIGTGKLKGGVAASTGQAVTANLSDLTTDSATPPKRYRVLLDRLAMRASPDVNAAVVERLASGATVESLPQPPKAYWSAVRIGDKRGWVATQWLAAEQ
ncbi:type II and III secretion system protein [Herbaspirillum sp. HC18]|nr:type II and III secretion system protein [Herbaspirillum sp. HC18]